MRKILILLSILILTGTGCSKKDVIKISHKNYTEQRLMGQLLSVYLKDNGYNTKVVTLGGTMLCFKALETGDIDMYVDYSGTIYGAVFGETEVLPFDETMEFIRNKEDEYKIKTMEPLGFNNTFVLSVTKETAEELGISTITDLIPYSKDMVLGCDLEFSARADGLVGLMETYEGLEFKSVKNMDQGLTYQAVDSGEVDVNVSYSTDGRIEKFGLLNLEDDKKYFPPYDAIPLLEDDFANENPEVVELLKNLKGQWTEKDMQKYNLKVEEGANPKDVARDMLKSKGLID
ncbi:MAG: glycine betaine ABC transporter substrate-binding protein [Lachnospirales bacterium]